MPSKLLSEFVAKSLYYRWRKNGRCYAVNRDRVHEDLELIGKMEKGDQKFVIKVDQQIKGRMKKGLVKLNVDLNEIPTWVNTIDNKYINFIVEPMVENISEEIYLLMRNFQSETEIILIMSGGINVGNIDVMDNVPKISLKYSEFPEDEKLKVLVGSHLDMIPFIQDIYKFYMKYHLTFLEINPLAFVDQYLPLDMLAKYDKTSLYLWDIHDREILEKSIQLDDSVTEEEKNIEKLAEKTGSSLKFKLLNINSRIWFILFGGGASICFFDKLMKMSETNHDLLPANYGELSGNPSCEFVYEYTKQIFSLMSKSENLNGKKSYLVIGGGIANFTLVDKTFIGIINAINDYKDMLLKKNTVIYVRRGGPNYKLGLELLRDCCMKHGIECYIYGPEKPMTQIMDDINYIEMSTDESIKVYDTSKEITINDFSYSEGTIYPFNKDTTCLIFGSQIDVAQNMYDFDIKTGRILPSVVGFIDPARRSITNVPLFWNTESILVPVYPNIEIAIKNHPKVNGIINFASYRAAYESTRSALKYDNIKFVSILAEGIEENQVKELIDLSRKSNKMILGPSTIGAIFPGKFRIGNAGGKIDYLLENGLHRVGKIGIVTRSGGLLNELCYIASNTGLGISAAIAIGGDRYTGTSFSDIVRYYNDDDNVKIIIMLGEIGGLQEIIVANQVKNNVIKKPIVGLCLGSSADLLSNDIQFGHAGADAHNKYESASYKNSYMAQCGIIVPHNWEDIAMKISEIADTNGMERSTLNINYKIPLPFDEAYKTGLVRKQPNFFSSISNEKDHEVTYNKKAVSKFQSIGDVIGNLWFKKELPEYLTEYFEKILIICADHGPCVSGAQNTMVAARAGKDPVSSLCSGLLTIGPKFGGAISEAALKFYYGMKNKKDPIEFVRETKIIPGIGHKHYSIHKPDNRVEVLDRYVKEKFTFTETIKFARSVEKITLQKKVNLILNVDGFIAASLIDGFISSGFNDMEIEEILDNDILNSFFILSRTIGLLGHHIDQKRLKQDLYRAPAYDIAYLE